MVRYLEGRGWAVVHGHKKKPGSKTDKAPGTPIKIYPGGRHDKGARKKALAMHYAIRMSQKRRACK